jgi:hypothetical protein
MSVEGIAMLPSPAPSTALQCGNQVLATPVASAPRNRAPGNDHGPSADVGSSASFTLKDPRETPLLPIEPDRDTAQTRLVSAHDFPSDTIDDTTVPASGRLTPETEEAIDGQYLGPSSAQSFLGKALRRYG